MKKSFTFFVILIVACMLLLPPGEAQAQGGQNSGTVADYAGTWILENMTVEDTYWTLDISADGNYRLHNQYQNYEGKIDFGPAEADSPPLMFLDLDPANGIDMVLICTANTLVDFSQQNLTFIRPGSEATGEDVPIDITGDFIGDWLFTGVTVYHPSATLELSADELFSSETPGAMRWLINLKDGLVSYTALRGTSDATSAPIARYRQLAGGVFMYRNPVETTTETKLIGRISGDQMALQPFPVGEDLLYSFPLRSLHGHGADRRRRVIGYEGHHGLHRCLCAAFLGRQ